MLVKGGESVWPGCIDHAWPCGIQMQTENEDDGQRRFIRHCDITWASLCLKSSAIGLFLQQLVHDKNNDNIEALHYWPFMREATNIADVSPFQIMAPTCGIYVYSVFKRIDLNSGHRDNPCKDVECQGICSSDTPYRCDALNEICTYNSNGFLICCFVLIRLF